MAENELRTSDLILRIGHTLKTRQRASGQAIMKDIEDEFGSINPNTLNFVLSKLIREGAIQRNGKEFELAKKLRR